MNTEILNTKTLANLRIHMESFLGDRTLALIKFSSNSQKVIFGNTDDFGNTIPGGINVELRAEIDDSLKMKILAVLLSKIRCLQEDGGKVLALRVRHATNLSDPNTNRREMIAYCFLVEIDGKTSIVSMLAPLLRHFSEKEVVVKEGEILCGGQAYKCLKEPPISVTLFGGENENVTCFTLIEPNGGLSKLVWVEGSYLMESADFEASLSLLV